MRLSVRTSAHPWASSHRSGRRSSGSAWACSSVARSRRASGVNSLLRVAGTYAIALFVMSHIWGSTVSQPTSAITSGLTLAAGLVAAAVAAGAVAAQLPQSVRNAAMVAGIWLVPWLMQTLPHGLQSLGPAVPAEFVGNMLVTMVVPPIAAAFLVLSAAVASRARFVPREPA